MTASNFSKALRKTLPPRRLRAVRQLAHGVADPGLVRFERSLDRLSSGSAFPPSLSRQEVPLRECLDLRGDMQLDGLTAQWTRRGRPSG